MSTIEDHNDRIERAAVIGITGIYTFLAVFVFAAFIAIVITTTAGLQLTLSIIAFILAFILAVFAVWFATISMSAVNIFRFLALIFALYFLAYAIYETVLLFQFIISSSSSGSSVIVGIISAVVFALFSYIFLAIAIAFFIEGTRFYNSLVRVVKIEETQNPPQSPESSDIETPTPSAPPLGSQIRHRAIGVILQTTK
jgi:hypothetical protein